MVDAIAGGTGKIVNFVPGKGASFTVGMDIKVSVRILEDTHITHTISNVPAFVKEIVQNTMDFFGYDYGIEMKIKNEIPPSSGLGDREAISAATVMATAGAIAKKHGSVNELIIDKYMSEQFLIINNRIVDRKKLVSICSDAGSKVNMEFDRLCSSFYGGFVVTDNRTGEILRRGGMENLYAVILLPKEKGGIHPDEVKLFQDGIEIAWNEALRGNLYSAMKLNTLVYDGRITRMMLMNNALSVTISYPSIIALVRDRKKIDGIRESIQGMGSVLVRNISNNGARLLLKPKRKVRMREFLKLKGNGKFHLL